MREGPSLEAMMDRLAAIPPEFTEGMGKAGGKKSGVKLPALVNDLLTDLGGGHITPEEVKALETSPEKKPHLEIVAILCHIYHDPALRELSVSHEKIRKFFLSRKPEELASCIDDAGIFITDPERREEICRLALNVTGMYPSGENEKRAKERLATLDSVEREKILDKTREAQKRAREIREAMLRKEAEEAASKMSRE
ncbi:MAG TPA: hypothetical protein PK358_14835 [Spirochaetota bacterium]|nr:hypothetical protein [Spirochaetota bacterium]HPJ36113.1 hypothetical protein [Spirochaetota bacterium]